MGPVYIIIVPLQCRQVCLYVKTEFPYYSLFTMISAVLLHVKHPIVKFTVADFVNIIFKPYV